MKDDLLALAERCEAATGPDRELDGMIAAAFGLKHGPDGGFCNDENGDYWTTDQCAARVTASLDAAMTLVPEGLHWIVSTTHPDGEAPPCACVGLPGSDEDSPLVRAATPALALTAASLRARALAEKEG